ncbi:hypothetical protein AGABI1DRAFT_71600 [Agaricus bisporus var. burnettii JB137-S8]|uniref:Zn(2)-C6 fungal-type domain-containing protein n=1 Tax=Agaricus bisporus var. burnettii (strain JB137-S8 / ATCC MYA-4627 / FGSC 10392) TaxID=597362 RepID=K5XCC4_AGABU|nr:hypothetical protein AGABI2DRAFT_150877 [Agaricus bisporus var. bisporus H97]XP_007328160.1 uncharacterized protein AGABI1DRAFT_71600 [Agaricus bisporus var. burnettii JB137-S8]EKM80953.1 hypothetical protein AGABI1DRAFT_71600 [Agaricus bisporus var. burnettii JB137-S8]EKV47434.1 hypothetical protein AGABI2DRAFT_150877 [Agaricus bisporus var. bisporus H97]
MSLSPATSISNGTESASKRQRTGSTDPSMNGESSSAQPPANIPKRGARACTNCRRGKNRCEGEAPCRRCQASGTLCVFEKPEKKNAQALSSASVERLSRLEGQYLVMQSQMIGMQSSLDRILSAIQTQQGNGTLSASQHAAASMYSQSLTTSGDRAKSFPPLPGFAPPPHKYASYGIVPSTAPSTDDESEDTLPRSSLNAPIEALQGLANAAAEAAAAPSAETSRVKKRKRAEPIPRNAFPHVVEKGLVTDSEARELFNIFFAGCHLFIPLFDPVYDTYESLMERSPWTFDAILAVAGKIRSGNGPLSSTFYQCLEEAQGIARSSLFGPVVRKEAVQGMLLLAAWSTNGWLPSGHAMRMALDLGLHRALEKLVEDNGKKRSEEEERNLVVSARIWCCLYWFDHQMSLGTGRPIVLRDENSIRHSRILLNHPMVSPTDVRLVALVDLIAQKTQIYETLVPLNGQVNHNTLSFIRRAFVALDNWWSEHDELHRHTMDQESLLRKILAGELHYAKLWVVCVALRGVAWDKMPFEQRELAFQAKDAASNCLTIFLNSSEYRAALRYAVHDSLVTAAFSGLFLLKMANLFPTELDLGAITAQVEQLAQLLSDVAAERYALTLRIMLANLRRKVGMASGINNPAPTMPPPAFAENMIVSPAFADPAMPPPFTMEELGFVYPSDRGIVSPAAIPVWLQEQSLTDLGLPVNGSDGVFLQMNGANGWAGDFPSMPEAW